MTHPVPVSAYGYPMATLVDGHWVVGPPDSVVTSTWGTWRVEAGAVWDVTTDPPTKTFNGTDITTIVDVPTLLDSLTWGEPYGEQSGQITNGRLTPFDEAAWLAEGTFVDIWHVVGGVDHSYWHGFVASIESADAPGLSNGVSLQLLGAFFGEASMRAHQPTMLDDDRDVGTSLGQALNVAAYSRPLPPFRGFSFESATTGITTRHRGSRGQYVIDFADELLALAQDSGGQWTISRTYGEDGYPQARKYQLRLKSEELAGAIQESTVFAGGYGVSLSLAKDVSEAPNAIYGEGLSPALGLEGGDRWRNAKYPMLTTGAPAYPVRLTDPTPPTYPLVEGDDDTQFTEDVITALTSQLRMAGWPDVQIGQYFTTETETAIVEMKETLGWSNTDPSINDDAEWDLVWSTGTGYTDLSSGFFRPLAEVRESQPYLFAADGDVTGLNDTGPHKFDGRMRVERMVSFADSISKARASVYARRVVNQAVTGATWSGTITLTSDPTDEEGAARSRLDIREGSWLRVNNLAGGTYLDFYVAGVAQAVETEGFPTTLTVSQKAWDLLDLSTRLERDREARTDPAKSFYSLRNRPNRPWRDVVGWDRESGAGILPPTVLSAGWNVVKCIGAQRGTIAAIKAWTKPAATYALAVFGDEITTGVLDTIVPDPLAEDVTKAGWWNATGIQSTLDSYGFIESWGAHAKACGYWPGAEDNTPTPDVTGKVVDAASWSFVSLVPPFLWVAIWNPSATPVTIHLQMRIVIEE